VTASRQAAQQELLFPPAEQPPQTSTRRRATSGPIASSAPDSPVSHPVPQPEDQPTLQLWPQVGNILGLGRAATYDAARRGEIPTIRFGRRIVVPTAALRRLLALDTATP
jgi:Helix-turn-helix domain